ncbi:hypothetical protein ABK040_003939 [Willaertia magna]
MLLETKEYLELSSLEISEEYYYNYKLEQIYLTCMKLVKYRNELLPYVKNLKMILVGEEMNINYLYDEGIIYVPYNF